MKSKIYGGTLVDTKHFHLCFQTTPFFILAFPCIENRADALNIAASFGVVLVHIKFPKRLS